MFLAHNPNKKHIWFSGVTPLTGLVPGSDNYIKLIHTFSLTYTPTLLPFLI